MKRCRFALLLVAWLAASPVLADETLVAHLFRQRFPQSKVENVVRAPVGGLYEVYADGRLWYVDQDVEYIFHGTLSEARSRRNLTAARLDRLAAVPLARLPFDLAFPVVRGNGRRQVALFADPECIRCRELERELARVANVTVHVFLVPDEQLRPGSTVQSTRIWCAADRASAWTTRVLQGGQPNGREDCITPFAQTADLARRLRIAGLPTLILADGTRLSGAVSASVVEAALDAVQRRSALAERE